MVFDEFIIEMLSDNKGNVSLMRFIVLGCFITGSFAMIAGVFMKVPEAIWAGSGLAAVGIAGKFGQKKIEEK